MMPQTAYERLSAWHRSQIATALRVLSNDPPPSVAAAAERTIHHSRAMLAHLYRIETRRREIAY